VSTAKSNQFFGEAGVARLLVEALKIHLKSAAAMEKVCLALITIAVDGELMLER